MSFYNALHRFWGPLALAVVAFAAGLPRGYVAGPVARTALVAFDRTIGLRSPVAFSELKCVPEVLDRSELKGVSMSTIKDAASEFVPNKRVAVPAVSSEPKGVSRAGIGLAAGLLVIGAGLAVVAALGPFVSGVIEYHVTETLRNQTIGLDAASLLVVAPLSVVAALLVLRRHVAGPALALGVGAYTSYIFLQYILGPEYERLPGNNELLFPLYLVLFASGWLVAIAAWNAFDVARLAQSRRRDRLVGRVVLPLLAFVAFFRYLPSLADWMSAEPEASGYLAGPTFAWAIAMLDLGVFLPATIIACVGLVRGTRWAQKALYFVVGWFGLVGPAVAAMAITMYFNDDPNASGGNAIFITTLGLAFAALAFSLCRSLFARAQGTSR